MITGYRDPDLKILQMLDDKSLFNFCRSAETSKHGKSLCEDENLWRNRTISRFPELIKFKRNAETWRNFYISEIRSIDYVLRKYNIPYFVSPKYDPRLIIPEKTDDARALGYLFDAAVSAGNTNIARQLEESIFNADLGIAVNTAINVGRENNIAMVRYISTLVDSNFILEGALENNNRDLIALLVRNYDADPYHVLEWSVQHSNVALLLLAYDLDQMPDFHDLLTVARMEKSHNTDNFFNLMLSLLVNNGEIDEEDLSEIEQNVDPKNIDRIQSIEKARRTLEQR